MPSAATVTQAAAAIGPLDHLAAGVKAVAGNLSADALAEWCSALAPQMRLADVTTANRIGAFLGQWAHESAGFTALSEDCNYSVGRIPQVFPKLARRAVELAGKPEALANAAYANRFGNGNEASGDGWRFRGGGLCQLTFRGNYQDFARSVGVSVEDAADYVRAPVGAVASACWFWTRIGGNALADAWAIDDLTRRINGGDNGAAQRQMLCNKARIAVDRG